jgi:tripeptide aminopeptidase
MVFSIHDTGYTMRERIQELDRTLGWGWLPEITQFVLEQAMQLQQIPAPTFAEHQRAAYVQQQFADLGLHDIDVDDMLNVYGRWPGTHREKPAAMVAAHTDTVFAAETDLSLKHTSGQIHGPGLGDNCVGVAGMLGLLAACQRQHITPARDIWFVATTREEGLGNLDGMKAAYQRLKSHIAGVINLEGLAFGHIYHAGIAVRRLKIELTAEGGHSWLHFGRPSATHSLITLGQNIISLQPPTTPRTTYNIGMIEGGQGINVIATRASMWLDMRSEDPAALAKLEQHVRTLIEELDAEDIQCMVEVVGDRPAGRLRTDHPLVQGALAALEQTGAQGVLETGSTDANVPLADGCPAVTIGITRGGKAHRLDEYIETEPVSSGLKQLILLTLGYFNA